MDSVFNFEALKALRDSERANRLPENVTEVIGDVFGVATKFRSETKAKGNSIEITLSAVLPALRFDPASGVLQVFPPPTDW